MLLERTGFWTQDTMRACKKSSLVSKDDSAGSPRHGAWRGLVSGTTVREPTPILSGLEGGYEFDLQRRRTSCCVSTSVSVCHARPEVSITKWWMKHYGAPTPKRHYMMANSPWYTKLDRGPLKRKKDMPVLPRVVTVQKYIDSAGKRRWKGTKLLRQTESLDLSRF